VLYDHRKAQNVSESRTLSAHLGIFLFGWETDVAPVAYRMVAGGEIMHVQVALIQKRAAAAHFWMGIGNVLDRADIMRRPTRSRWR
jgi:hypothetical protein